MFRLSHGPTSRLEMPCVPQSAFLGTAVSHHALATRDESMRVPVPAWGYVVQPCATFLASIS